VARGVHISSMIRLLLEALLGSLFLIVGTLWWLLGSIIPIEEVRWIFFIGGTFLIIMGILYIWLSYCEFQVWKDLREDLRHGENVRT